MSRVEVLSVREFRAGLADTIKRVRGGGPVFVGAHRKAEAVLMSIEQYDELVATAGSAAVPRRVAVEEAVASVRLEGLEPSPVGRLRIEAVAEGRLSPEEAIEQALAPYGRDT